MAWVRLFWSHFAVYYRGPTFCVVLLFLSSPKPVMAAPVQPNPDALAALAAPPAAPPVIPLAPAQPALAADGGVAQAAQAAPVQREEVCSWLVVFPVFCLLFLLRRFFLLASFHCQSSASFCTTCSFRFLLLALVCRLLASRFRFFYRCMSVRPPVLLLFISRRVFYLIWYFVVRSTVYNCLPWVLPLLVLASVRLLQVFGRVFGCLGSLAVCSAVRSVWPCVRLLQVFGRVFGCFKCLAVCSAVF